MHGQVESRARVRGQARDAQGCVREPERHYVGRIRQRGRAFWLAVSFQWGVLCLWENSTWGFVLDKVTSLDQVQRLLHLHEKAERAGLLHALHSTQIVNKTKTWLAKWAVVCRVLLVCVIHVARLMRWSKFRVRSPRNSQGPERSRRPKSFDSSCACT